MVQINILYEGELHCTATHPSGTILHTDAPKDNKGKGESFSPTDLVATALGSCMLTVMGIEAQTLNIDLRGATVRVEKAMIANPERRIGTLTAHIHVPTQVSEAERQKLMDAAHRCPVHKSLHPDVHTPIEFTWG